MCDNSPSSKWQFSFFLIAHMSIRKQYFIKDSLKWVRFQFSDGFAQHVYSSMTRHIQIPFFGWGMWLAGFIFVRRNWMQDQHRISATFAKLNRLQAPIWVMSFVEGSRLNATKLREAQIFSEQRGLPVMQNVLVPRTKGFVTCVTHLRGSHVRHVYGK